LARRMAVAASTRRHVDDHLGQAEFALKVAANFECLKGTPAQAAVRAALAEVAGARTWVRDKLAVEPEKMEPVEGCAGMARERQRQVQRRMARLAP
jgi:hypothetical protein